MFHMLDLENGKKCEYDHVELIDKLTGKRLSKLCGTKFPKDYIMSQGNKMRVKFNTDSDVHHKGFSLSFITGELINHCNILIDLTRLIVNSKDCSFFVASIKVCLSHQILIFLNELKLVLMLLVYSR